MTRAYRPTSRAASEIAAIGAPGPTRTDTPVKELDFESSASTIPPQGHAGALASDASTALQTVHGASGAPPRFRAMKTADFFVQRLKAWGVRRIFGYSGDGINGVI